MVRHCSAPCMVPNTSDLCWHEGPSQIRSVHLCWTFRAICSWQIVRVCTRAYHSTTSSHTFGNEYSPVCGRVIGILWIQNSRKCISRSTLYWRSEFNLWAVATETHLNFHNTSRDYIILYFNISAIIWMWGSSTSFHWWWLLIFCDTKVGVLSMMDISTKCMVQCGTDWDLEVWTPSLLHSPWPSWFSQSLQPLKILNWGCVGGTLVTHPVQCKK